MPRDQAATAERVPFLDLGALHSAIGDDLLEAFEAVVREGAFVGGRFVEAFEQSWADYCGVRHAVGVANGTDAIELVLRALDIGPGDEVIVPANTFVATAEAVAAAGARPVFCDVDDDTLLMTAATVADCLGPATAAVIVVHLYGQPVGIDDITALARGAGIAVIEDAAQAHGATSKGRRAGSLGHAACFSFYPGKNLGALGDGGAVTTDDPMLADTIRSLGNHGRVTSGQHGLEAFGRNSRLDGMQAAFLQIKLGWLDEWNAGRARAALDYDACLGSLGIRAVSLAPDVTSSHHLYVARVADREAVRAELAAEGIATGVHYPIPVHHQPAFFSAQRERLPVVEASSQEILSLPMSPTLSSAQVELVSRALGEAVSRHDRSPSATTAPAR